MDIREVEKLHVKTTNLAFAGLIAISVVILQALISTATLDLTELISLSCFSLALPILAGGVVVNFVGIEMIGHLFPQGTTPSWAQFLIWAAFTIDILGIVAAIWHASWIAGILFLITTLFSFAIYLPSIRKMLQKAYARASDPVQM
jgi:hypothetical protein